ncbi:acyl-CoA carboxylase subunit epsilon [Microbacterium pumilum]|uniref:Acyl-CoA carboxylase subunit epsilon n=1 Tax=Microbacterium pumilum TaxID=344165 RepID=A0ABP5DQP3_9MICO
MSEAEPDDDLTIEVRRGAPADDELAALIAVVSESYAREFADAVVDDEQERSAWALSQRSLREPLRRELGWGRWGG